MSPPAGSVRGPGPFLVAHRGCSAEAPENTLAAFELAISGGVPIVECDVHRTRDGVAVVLHDATLDRTTHASGHVSDRDWDRLAGVDAGYPDRFGDRFAGTRLPRLDQLLDLARGRAQVMVEIKRAAVGPAHGGIEEGVLAALRKAGMLAQAIVISMSPRALRRLRAMAPELELGLVFPRRARVRLVERTLGVGATWLIAATPYLLGHPRIVAQARAQGLRLGAYVVNDAITLAQLVEAGVDSLASDCPLKLLAELDRVRKEDPVA
jgi:glycerophosphoryl diester phosphodiesterase